MCGTRFKRDESNSNEIFLMCMRFKKKMKRKKRLTNNNQDLCERGGDPLDVSFLHDTMKNTDHVAQINKANVYLFLSLCVRDIYKFLPYFIQSNPVVALVM